MNDIVKFLVDQIRRVVEMPSALVLLAIAAMLAAFVILALMVCGTIH